MVVAADDVGDAHVMVVHHHRQHIGGGAIRAQQHQIVQILVGEGNRPLHLILDHRHALLRSPQTHDRLAVRGALGGIAVAPTAVIARWAAFLARKLAHLVQLGGRGIAGIGIAARHHLGHRRLVPLGAGELVDDVPIPVDAEPRQAVQDGVDGLLGGTLPIGILDPQQHLPALPSHRAN